MVLRSKEDIRKLLPPEVDHKLEYEEDPANSIIRIIPMEDFAEEERSQFEKVIDEIGAQYVTQIPTYEYPTHYKIGYSPSIKEKEKYSNARAASAMEHEKILLQACQKFVEDLAKLRFSLVTIEDFRCAVHAEILKVMNTLRKHSYYVRTEVWYGIAAYTQGALFVPDYAHAHMALGEKKEVAVILKFSNMRVHTWHRPADHDFEDFYKKLKNCLAKGAKAAYILYLRHFDRNEDVSKKFDLSDFGLSGQWKTVPLQEGLIDNLLVATVAEKANT